MTQRTDHAEPANLTVIGGGLGGLVAAVAAAEQGARVRLLEAHRTLGGRARSTSLPYVANEGPHALYSDGAHWSWLAERGLTALARPAPLGATFRLRFRHEGRLRALPPRGVLAAAAHRRLRAPVDQDFTTWATGRFGDRAAAAVAATTGVTTYDFDPGRLSAAYVWERFQRLVRPGQPAARYVVGGWQALVDRLAARARDLGVTIETGARIDAVPTRTPVIVATSLPAARRLLRDPTLTWESGRTVLLDLGLRERRGDPFIVFDLDEAGFVERVTVPDPSLAPAGHSLVQAQLPLRPEESKAAGLGRLETTLDLALPGWRDRVTWRRDAVASGRTGAVDLPGTSWRDRPAIDRGDGVFLVGDQVAAPGMLGEVTMASARRAAELALAQLRPGGETRPSSPRSNATATAAARSFTPSLP
ncbi:NAD(P)-binding protein [Actinopolymorpha rutila]|uniref:Phytoene dehydrogenase-like protein n=1 Tax=Actinopolymorpha rutila TaxID=446787 RepID=A0A852ZGQ3_9ACTN|nr:NAD(P)-binding protein [Actinopolymorpha rutila]NYH87436.1 phytoene dehydrogenase-like protein [Actinopolymorpha rutila]